MKHLRQQLATLQQHISRHDLLNLTISQASVGWHIEHSLLVLNGIINTLKASDPADFRWSFNLKRTFIMLAGIFPRGKAKAPESVVPGHFDEASLTLNVIATENKLKELEVLDRGKFFSHPMMGHMKLKDATRFLYIHTKHHLDIIEDIVKSKR